VEVFIAEYQTQRHGAKLISSDNTLLGTGWINVEDGALQDPSPRGVKSVLATQQGEHWLITYVYEVSGVVSANPVVTQLVYGILSWKGPIPARVVAVAIHCGARCGQEELKHLSEFWSDMGPRLVSGPPRLGQ
jgi:hypothetical protein